MEYYSQIEIWREVPTARLRLSYCCSLATFMFAGVIWTANQAFAERVERSQITLATSPVAITAAAKSM